MPPSAQQGENTLDTRESAFPFFASEPYGIAVNWRRGRLSARIPALAPLPPPELQLAALYVYAHIRDTECHTSRRGHHTRIFIVDFDFQFDKNYYC